MRKLFLVLVLILSLAFVGFAENTGKQASVQENSFRVKPDLFLTFLSTIVIRSNWKCGLTLLGLDITAFEYKNWNFLGIGGGLAVHFHKNANPWFYDPYFYHEDSYYNQGWHYEKYRIELFPYLKIVPVKYHWNWLSRQLKIKAHLEMSFTTKKEIIVGFTLSDVFKKKR